MTSLDCGDSACWFAVDQTGQRTNAGCRCLKNLPSELRTRIHMSVNRLVRTERAWCVEEMYTEDELKVVVDEARQKERERCAKIADSLNLLSSEIGYDSHEASYTAAKIARRIRE